MNKFILYIGNFNVIQMNAAGKRILGNAKIMKELGYKVILIGITKNINAKCELNNNVEYVDGFDVYNFAYPQSNLSWLKYKSRLDELIRFIEKKNMNGRISHIIYYGSISIFMFNYKLINWSKKNNVKIISDCADWLLIERKISIFNIVKSLNDNIEKQLLNKKVDGIIVISKYLQRYYQRYKVKTILVPPVMDYNYNKLCESTCSEKKVVYAGVPFRLTNKEGNPRLFKDRLDKAIEYIAFAIDKGSRVEFNIYGLKKNEYLKVVPKHAEILAKHQNIIFHGSKENNVIQKYVSKADFTLLIRDKNRMTEAGFSTKLSESIFCGTPVITTKTSDIDIYLEDKKNAIFLHDDESENKKIIEACLNMSKSKIYKLKKNCLEVDIFYYKKYLGKMLEFLNTL